MGKTARETQDRDSRVLDGMLVQEEFKIYCEKWGDRKKDHEEGTTEQERREEEEEEVHGKDRKRQKNQNNADRERERFKATKWSESPAFFQQGLGCSFAIILVIWEIWDKRKKSWLRWNVDWMCHWLLTEVSCWWRKMKYYGRCTVSLVESAVSTQSQEITRTSAETFPQATVVTKSSSFFSLLKKGSQARSEQSHQPLWARTVWLNQTWLHRPVVSNLHVRVLTTLESVLILQTQPHWDCAWIKMKIFDREEGGWRMEMTSAQRRNLGKIVS